MIGESVTVAPDSDLPIPARYYHPASNGPWPTVLVVHGSGGLWKNDNPDGGVMAQHFEEWAQLLTEEGYAALFIDSYTPRGLVEFPNRKPAEDPALDDSKCSPAYERPKDIFKALSYLQARPDVLADRIALLGFSQGAETCLSSLLSTKITKPDWTMSYLKLSGTNETRSFPAPQRLPSGPGAAPGFRVACVFYPGCGYFGYFGSPSSEAANLYMPYAPTLIQHGGADPLYAANLYPERFVGKAASEATSLNLGFKPLSLIVYPEATHSFDEVPIAQPGETESANQTAKRLGRAEALRWFAAFLKPATLKIERTSSEIDALWTGAIGARQRLIGGTDVNSISNVVNEIKPVDISIQRVNLDADQATAMRFFRLQTTLPEPF